MARRRRGKKARPKPRKTVIRRRVRGKPRRLRKPTRVRRVEPEPLRLVERVIYRDRRGRTVSKGTPGARAFTYVFQLDRKGRAKRALEKTTPTTIMKTATVDMTGDDAGRIDWALVKSSATSVIGAGGVTMVEFTLKARDARGKERRFKVLMDLEAVRRKSKLYEAIVGRILELLRSHGYRTSYTLELFKKARRRGLKYPVTWDEWRSLEPLRDMEMIVTLYRR